MNEKLLKTIKNNFEKLKKYLPISQWDNIYVNSPNTEQPQDNYIFNILSNIIDLYKNCNNDNTFEEYISKLKEEYKNQEFWNATFEILKDNLNKFKDLSFFRNYSNEEKFRIFKYVVNNKFITYNGIENAVKDLKLEKKKIITIFSLVDWIVNSTILLRYSKKHFEYCIYDYQRLEKYFADLMWDYLDNNRNELEKILLLKASYDNKITADKIDYIANSVNDIKNDISLLIILNNINND